VSDSVDTDRGVVSLKSCSMHATDDLYLVLHTLRYGAREASMAYAI